LASDLGFHQQFCYSYTLEYISIHCPFLNVNCTLLILSLFKVNFLSRHDDVDYNSRRIRERKMDQPMATLGDQSRRPVFRVALAALLSAVVWLALNVAFNYQGHISGLFYTGTLTPVPGPLQDHTYYVKDEKGYDASFYHFAAHDPLLHRGFASYVDNASLRWRRIGVPGLAALLVWGNDRLVDYAYIAIQLAFVFLGAFWLGRYAQACIAPAVWGLAFLLIPAVAVSLDRMTIDLPLAALWIAVALYGPTLGKRWPVYAALCAAPLIRETGMLLVIAWCLYSARRKDWRDAVLGLCCAVPAILWWVYVYRHTPRDGTPWLVTYPFSGLIERTLHGTGEPTFTWWLQMAAVFETLAIAGIWLALFLAFYLAYKRRAGINELSAVLYAIFVAALGKLDIWTSAYATGRTMSPLLIALGLTALKERRYYFSLPLVLILPRLALQYEAQLAGIIRGILR
jgi:hypothetical protein